MGEPCKKVTFETRELAIQRVEEIKTEEKRKKTPLRSYRCETCSKFHLTSISKKKQSFIKRLPEIKRESRINLEASYWIEKNNWDTNEDLWQ